jgi:2-C-methyl-D-erythritol 2,4-cyclodiphosphate synthase
MIRTGIGYDVHQLVKGEKLVVGSVEIVSSIGSLGHSDGDALIHSICDALLGAANLGDLGHFFPSEDVKWKDSESVYFLKDVISKIENKGFTINNIDATVILEKPKLGNYIPSIKKKLSSITNLNASQISIKATTTDKLGFIGRESGWAVLAIATITDNNE